MSGCQEDLRYESVQNAKRHIGIKFASLKRRIKRNSPILQIVCNCGNKFTTHYEQSKYCSDKCRIDAKKELQKESSKRRNKEKRRECCRRYYVKNKEQISLKLSNYYKTEKGREAKRRYYKRQKERFPEKIEARKIVKLLIACGKLKPLPCEKCGNLKVHGHHDDYSKPDIVRWLCAKCHSAYHREIRKYSEEVKNK